MVIAFWEIIISRAMPGGRREIEMNSGSLSPIPGGLATLTAVNQMFARSGQPAGEVTLRHMGKD